MSHKISLRLIGNMEYKHRVFVCVISSSIQQFHLIKHSSPLAMDSWTPPRPEVHRKESGHKGKEGIEDQQNEDGIGGKVMTEEL